MSHATPVATKRYAEAKVKAGLNKTSYRVLGRTGLVCSAFGFGTYRVDDLSLPHFQSLELALKEGINLIDTSTNYTDGGSERCVGKVLKTLNTKGQIKRDEVIVVSKVGYVQGENLKEALLMEKGGAPFPDMVKYMDGCWHCIHPKFIRSQIKKTLSRTGLSKVDVCLLHNPEYFLMNEAKKPELNKHESTEEFYRRIEAAFQCLEELVKEGFISHYGVSSNTLGLDGSDFETTSLTRFWEIASRVAEQTYGDKGRHHFSVIQFPLNYFEAQPLKILVSEATEYRLGVLINRPLNAILENQLVRLADLPSHPADFTSWINKEMDSLLPEVFHSKRTSEKNLAWLARSPGIHCVLNGMRRPSYVREAASLMGCQLS